MWDTQGNIIFHFTHAIFDEGLFPKCTNFHAKECKLYNKLLDKTSLKTEELDTNSFEKDGPAPVSISHIPILSTHSPLSPLSYKSTFSPLTPEPKKPIVEIGEINDVNSDVEI